MVPRFYSVVSSKTGSRNLTTVSEFWELLTFKLATESSSMFLINDESMFAGITEKPPKKTRSKPRKKVLTAPAVLPAFKSEPIGLCPLFVKWSNLLCPFEKESSQMSYLFQRKQVLSLSSNLDSMISFEGRWAELKDLFCVEQLTPLIFDVLLSVFF